MKFLRYDNAHSAACYALDELRKEGYRTACLEVEIVKTKDGFYVNTKCSDSAITQRFRFLLKEYVKKNHKAFSFT